MVDATAEGSSDVQTALGAAAAAADGLAASSLQMIDKVHQARLARLNREASALKAQRTTSATALAATEAEIAAETTTTARVAMLSQRTTTVAPTVSVAGWALHGRLYSSNLAPAATCTVYLVDAQNAYQTAYGFAYTDATGYFALTAAASSGAGVVSATLAVNTGAAATGTGSAASSAGAATSATAATGASGATKTPAQLFVAAADQKGEPVFLSPTPFTPTPGVATYLTLVMPSGGAPIGNPPAAVGAAAPPKT
jgi:hypothetical protein